MIPSCGSSAYYDHGEQTACSFSFFCFGKATASCSKYRIISSQWKLKQPGKLQLATPPPLHIYIIVMTASSCMPVYTAAVIIYIIWPTTQSRSTRSFSKKRGAPHPIFLCYIFHCCIYHTYIHAHIIWYIYTCVIKATHFVQCLFVFLFCHHGRSLGGTVGTAYPTR